MDFNEVLIFVTSFLISRVCESGREFKIQTRRMFF